MSSLKNNIIEEIYQVYPRNRIWESVEYKESVEHKKLISMATVVKLEALAKYIQHILKNVCCGYAIVPWSNFEEYICVEFKILLHKNQDILDDDIELLDKLGGIRRDLHIYISAINKYFYLDFNQTKFESGKWSFSRIIKPTDEEVALKNNIIELFFACGYTAIEREMAKTVLPDVQTELKEFGQARIFDCLFTDLKADL